MANSNRFSESLEQANSRARKEELLWKIRRLWVLRQKFAAKPIYGSPEDLELEQLHNDLMGYDLMGMLIDEVPLFKARDFRHDPLAFARAFFPDQIQPWQEEALADLKKAMEGGRENWERCYRGRWPSHIGVDFAHGPDETVIRTASGEFQALKKKLSVED
jgi:hypothetical protein